MKTSYKVGENIKRLRKLHSITQIELARLACISSHCVSMIETGKRSPMIETVAAIAYALNVSIDDIVTVVHED